MTLSQKHFEEKWIPEPNSGCWLWCAGARGNGYGGFYSNGQMYYAHRASWLIYRGRIPRSLHVLHSCDTRLCVNPSHLFLGTNQDNVDDMCRKRRQHNMVKTHCFRGHPLAGKNLRIDSFGCRRCRICGREHQRRYLMRKRLAS